MHRVRERHHSSRVCLQNNIVHCFEDRPGRNDGARARDALLTAGIAASNVLYRFPNPLGPHIDRGTNVAGYLTHGIHGWHGDYSSGVYTIGNYATDGTVIFTNESSWYIMMTVESTNGTDRRVLKIRPTKSRGREPFDVVSVTNGFLESVPV